MQTFLDMTSLKSINYRQPKYALPALTYIPILFTVWAIISAFHTEVKEDDRGMVTTEYLNASLPSANIKDDGIGNRYDNMKKSFGRIQDFSAVDIVERDEGVMLEDFESRYSEEERRLLSQDAEARARKMEELRKMQQAIREGASGAEGLADLEPEELQSEESRLQKAQARQDAAMEELNRLLAEARLSGQRKVAETMDSLTAPVRKDRPVTKSTPVAAPDPEPAQVMKSSGTQSAFFNTISTEGPSSSLIRAIIDENITAVDGSRVRLRLLEDVWINGDLLPKGTYLYAVMSGFGSQRVQGAVSSILVEEEPVRVSLALYDTDGLEGLYVPSSRFRETARNVGSGAMGGTMNFSSAGSSGDMARAWGMNAISNAYQKSTSAVSSAIRQNKARLKYGTQVYLINRKEKRDRQ